MLYGTDPNDWNTRFVETPPIDVFPPQMSLATSAPKPEREEDEYANSSTFRELISMRQLSA